MRTSYGCHTENMLLIKTKNNKKREEKKILFLLYFYSTFLVTEIHIRTHLRQYHPKKAVNVNILYTFSLY